MSKEATRKLQNKISLRIDVNKEEAGSWELRTSWWTEMQEVATWLMKELRLNLSYNFFLRERQQYQIIITNCKKLHDKWLSALWWYKSLVPRRSTWLMLCFVLTWGLGLLFTIPICGHLFCAQEFWYVSIGITVSADMCNVLLRWYGILLPQYFLLWFFDPSQ